METIEKHLACNNFEAWISVDGKALPQYNEEHNPRKNEATCWIPSQTDQAFSISYHKKMSDEYDYEVEILLDGNCVINKVYKGHRRALIQTREYIRISEKECRSLLFGSIELTDDDNYLDIDFREVGEIKVVIFKAKETTRSSCLTPFPAVPDPPKIHERAKKGLAHQIRYGSAIPARRIRLGQGMKYYRYHGTIAIFTFRYRPLALLRANGIAPRAESPAAAVHDTANTANSLQSETRETKVAVSDDEDQVPEAILARERALLAELEQVRLEKRAAASKDAQPRKRIKNEASQIQSPFVSGEIIDLT